MDDKVRLSSCAGQGALADGVYFGRVIHNEALAEGHSIIEH